MGTSQLTKLWIGQGCGKFAVFDQYQSQRPWRHIAQCRYQNFIVVFWLCIDVLATSQDFFDSRIMEAIRKQLTVFSASHQSNCEISGNDVMFQHAVRF